MKQINMEINNGVSLRPAKKNTRYSTVGLMALIATILDTPTLMNNDTVILSRTGVILSTMMLYVLYFMAVVLVIKLLDYVTFPNKLSILNNSIALHIGILNIQMAYDNIIIENDIASTKLDYFLRKYNANKPMLLTLKKGDKRLTLVFDESEINKLNRD